MIRLTKVMRLSLLAALLVSHDVAACRSACKVPGIAEAFAAAKVVLLGEVVTRTDGGMTDVLGVHVIKVWKGPFTQELTVQTESHTCDPLGDMATVGQRVILFASPGVSPFNRKPESVKELVAGFCSGSVVPANAGKEYEYARQLDALVPGNTMKQLTYPSNGTVQKRAAP